MSYLHWDPSPEMFHVDLPFLHRGILWYGFLFAFGFFVGYSIFLYMIRRYLLFSPEFREKDILSWSELIRKLKSISSSSPLFFLVSHLPLAVKSYCEKWKAGDSIPKEVKQAILQSCNAFLSSQNPCSQPRTSLSQRLLSFARAHLANLIPLKKRFFIDEECPFVFLSIKKHASLIAEKVTIYVVIGTLIGARLGDVFFYQDWDGIIRDPFSIFKIWEGGLASHGAAVGIFIALWLFSKKIHIAFLRILDLVVVPTALAGLFIRVGNFFNQEILGVATRLPWGIIFEHPMGTVDVVPRHPVQLYEALWYAIVFLFLFSYFKRNPRLKKPGRITGLFFVLVFVFRFFVEFLKLEQSRLLDMDSFLTMGQWLSLPLIFAGLFLLYKTRKVTR